MYQELYNRRENVRFLGVPESMADEEDTKEVIYQLLEKERLDEHGLLRV